tara:strand:- start:282 stop:602 length:321 start_codon:yes stop_codon:yes gene_type:complete
MSEASHGGKGDKSRIKDRSGYAHNWDTVFGRKKESPLLDVIDQAMQDLHETYPQTMESLDDDHTSLWNDDPAKVLREWSIMMDFLRDLQYEDYPVQAAKELYESFK